MSSEKGLENPKGAYNCFINVVVQSLWHIESFKAYFLEEISKHRHSVDELKSAKSPMNLKESTHEGGILISQIAQPIETSSGVILPKEELKKEPEIPSLKKEPSVDLENPSTFCLICSLYVF